MRSRLDEDIDLFLLTDDQQECVQGDAGHGKGNRARTGTHLPEPRSGRDGQRLHGDGDSTHTLLGSRDHQQ